MTPQETPQTESSETSAPSAQPEPNHEQIAALAYALWQERGCPYGSPDDDWFQAEKELLA